MLNGRKRSELHLVGSVLDSKYVLEACILPSISLYVLGLYLINLLVHITARSGVKIRWTYTPMRMLGTNMSRAKDVST